VRGQILGGETEYDNDLQDPQFHTELPLPFLNTGPVPSNFPQAPQFFLPPQYDLPLASTGQANFLQGDWTSNMDTISGSDATLAQADLYSGGPSYSWLANAATTAQQQISTSASLEGSHVVALRPVRGGEVSFGSHRQNFIQVLCDISTLSYLKANPPRLYKPLFLR
jgi:hypothetical protein